MTKHEPNRYFSPTMRSEDIEKALAYIKGYTPSTEPEMPREERIAIIKKLLRPRFGKKDENR